MTYKNVDSLFSTTNHDLFGKLRKRRKNNGHEHIGVGGVCRLVTGTDIPADELDHQTQVD